VGLIQRERDVIDPTEGGWEPSKGATGWAEGWENGLGNKHRLGSRRGGVG